MNDFELSQRLREIRIELVEIRKDINRIINTKLNYMATTLDDLKAKVDAEQTVEQSAITLMQGLSAQIKAAANDPAKIQAIASELDTNNAALAAAITANTQS
jgi:flagellar biosynthesis chaperone FliJ